MITTIDTILTTTTDITTWEAAVACTTTTECTEAAACTTTITITTVDTMGDTTTVTTAAIIAATTITTITTITMITTGVMTPCLVATQCSDPKPLRSFKQVHIELVLQFSDCQKVVIFINPLRLEFLEKEIPLKRLSCQILNKQSLSFHYSYSAKLEIKTTVYLF